jgi:hypothetical protein
VSWPRRPCAVPQATVPVTPKGSRQLLTGEWRTIATLPGVLARAPQLARIPRGDGAAVIDIPGWKAPEVSMAPLRGYLKLKGHDARSWGLGTNLGTPEADSRRLAVIVENLATTTGRPVALVGWSLGGVVARETARLVPDAVRHVITYGTPVIGGPTYTLAADAFGEAECRRVRELTEELDRINPIQVPITVMFSRNDRVVHWSACIDRTSPRVEHVEIKSTHLGMGIDPEVWAIVATQLGLSPSIHGNPSGD